jgi:hypothetical protein
MTRTLLAFLLLFSLSANAQSVAPPARPPLVRPVVNEPYFPTPGATPEGAGASHGSIPGATTPPRAKVPPSPNKRILPASTEPGLWAADGAPRASRSAPPALFGVTLPYPAWATEPETQWSTDMCIVGMHNSAVTTGMYNTIIKKPESIRACMAARAYLLCAMGIANKAAPDSQEQALLRNTEAHAQALVDLLCAGAGWTDDHAHVLLQASKDWIKYVNQFATAHRRH